MTVAQIMEPNHGKAEARGVLAHEVTPPSRETFGANRRPIDLAEHEVEITPA